MLGQLMECPACNETIEVQTQPKPPASAPSLQRIVPKLKLPMPPPMPGKLVKGKVYKVLTPRDKWFEGNYAPDKLEAAINFYAAKGWHVISVVSTGMPAAPGSPQPEIMVVMGRNS